MFPTETVAVVVIRVPSDAETPVNSVADLHRMVARCHPNEDVVANEAPIVVPCRMFRRLLVVEVESPYRRKLVINRDPGFSVPAGMVMFVISVTKVYAAPALMLSLEKFGPGAENVSVLASGMLTIGPYQPATRFADPG